MTTQSQHVCKGTIADMENKPAQGLAKPGRLELKRHFVELRAKGYSLARCAEQLHVSKSTLATWQQDLEAQIASLKAIELEALQEEFFVAKEGRLRLLGEQVKALREELETRALSDVPTDKLLDILLKYHQALREEYVEPRPLSGREIKRLEAETGTELDSQAVAGELDTVLQRYKAGLMDIQQARQELALLLAILKAQEQAQIEVKLERLEAILEVRN